MALAIGARHNNAKYQNRYELGEGPEPVENYLSPITCGGYRFRSYAMFPCL